MRREHRDCNRVTWGFSCFSRFRFVLQQPSHVNTVDLSTEPMTVLDRTRKSCTAENATHVINMNCCELRTHTAQYVSSAMTCMTEKPSTTYDRVDVTHVTVKKQLAKMARGPSTDVSTKKQTNKSLKSSIHEDLGCT